MTTCTNIILIAGSGRNVGKTYLACKLIENLSENLSITAVKISPHFHNEINQHETVYQNNHVIIQKESNSERNKDSSRMLKAGASEVFYVQVEDNHLSSTLPVLNRYIFGNKPVICESASLRKYLIPGIFFFVENNQNNVIKKNSDLKQKADVILQSDFDKKDLNINDIWFDGIKWTKVS